VSSSGRGDKSNNSAMHSRDKRADDGGPPFSRREIEHTIRATRCERKRRLVRSPPQRCLSCAVRNVAARATDLVKPGLGKTG